MGKLNGQYKNSEFRYRFSSSECKKNDTHCRVCWTTKLALDIPTSLTVSLDSTHESKLVAGSVKSNKISLWAEDILFCSVVALSRNICTCTISLAMQNVHCTLCHNSKLLPNGVKNHLLIECPLPCAWHDLAIDARERVRPKIENLPESNIVWSSPVEISILFGVWSVLKWKQGPHHFYRLHANDKDLNEKESSQLRNTKVVKHVTKYVRNGWQHVVRHMCESSAALHVQKDATILCPSFAYTC